MRTHMASTFVPTDWTQRDHVEYVLAVLGTWEDHGWKYRPLTDGTGLTYQLLYAYQTGRRRPTIAAAVKLERAIFDYKQRLDEIVVRLDLQIAEQRIADQIARDALDPAIEARRIPVHVRRMVHARYGGRCCHCQCDGDLQIDHVIPVSRGGDGDPSNLQVLCAACNRAKFDMTMAEWYAVLTAAARVS